MPLSSVILKDFRGGVNLRDNEAYPGAVGDNELTRVANIRLDADGGLYPREALGAVLDVSPLVNAYVRRLLVVTMTNANTYILRSDNVGRVSSRKLGGTEAGITDGDDTSVWDFEVMQDAAGVRHVWMLNGFDVPQKWNGTTVADWGGDFIFQIKACCVWKNRMVRSACHHSGDPSLYNRVWFSAIANPEDNNMLRDFIDVKSSDEDFDAVQDIAVLGDSLIVFKRNSVWRLTGDVPNVQAQRLGSPGVEGRFMCGEFEGRIYYVHRTGVYSTDGVSAPRKESELINPIFTDQAATFGFTGNYGGFYVAPDKWENARLTVDPFTGRIYVMLPTAQATGYVVLEMYPKFRFKRSDGYDHPSWMILYYNLRSGMTAGIAGPQFAVDRVSGRLILALKNSYYAFSRLGIGDADDLNTLDRPILPPLAETGWMGLKESETLERVRRINVLHKGPFELQMLKGPEPSTSFTGQQTNPNVTFTRFRPESRGRYHKLRFKSVNDEDSGTFPPVWEIGQTELVFRGGKEH